MTEVQKRVSTEMNDLEKMAFFETGEEVITLKTSFSGHPAGSKGVIVERCSDGTCLVSFDGGKTHKWSEANCVWMAYDHLEKIVDEPVVSVQEFEIAKEVPYHEQFNVGDVVTCIEKQGRGDWVNKEPLVVHEILERSAHGLMNVKTNTGSIHPVGFVHKDFAVVSRQQDVAQVTPVVKQKKYRKITQEELLDLKVGQKVKVKEDDGTVIKGQVLDIDSISPESGKYRIQLTNKAGVKYNIWFHDTGFANIGGKKIVKIKI